MLHGVEHAHFTRSWRPSRCAAWRIFSASGGVKFRTTPPPAPAACTTLRATEFASWIGTFSFSVCVGMSASLAMSRNPPAM